MEKATNVAVCQKHTAILTSSGTLASFITMTSTEANHQNEAGLNLIARLSPARRWPPAAGPMSGKAPGTNPRLWPPIRTCLGRAGEWHRDGRARTGPASGLHGMALWTGTAGPGRLSGSRVEVEGWARPARAPAMAGGEGRAPQYISI